MGYTPSFTPQYENGWENLPSETSPITAEAFNAYDDAIENVEEYLASDESQANLADAYDETATYEAGDYVIYGGDLYKCLEDIDEPEEWDSTKWKSCLITDEMATSGGTTVIANPSGQATETLTKLQVENTIYGVSGGGGNANIWTGTQAELEEVFDELEEGTQINITDDEQEVVEGGTIYSEEEQIIGLWTDSKPLYQKTITHVNTSQTNNVTVSSEDISIQNIEGWASAVEGGNDRVPLNYPSFLSAYQTNARTVSITVDSQVAYKYVTLTIQYTKSTDAPLDAVVGKKTMYIASSDCYSTEEKEVGCWHNGKPLYQRTYVFTNAVTCASQTWTTLTEATASNVEEIVSAVGQDANGTNFDALGCNFSNGAFGILQTRNTTITFKKFTVQYTKTTDTAGSGQYTPASGKAVHYSTDEQVIGTWIDGKPLYRKVLPPQSFNNTDVTYTHNLGVKHYINVYGSCTVNNGTAPRAFPYRQTRYNAYCEWNGATANDITFSATWSGNVVNAVLEYTKESDYSA